MAPVNITFAHAFASVTSIISSWWDDNYNAINTWITAVWGQASGLATLDSNTRVVEPANTLWDGAGNRSANPTPAANAIPVRNANKDLLDRNSVALYGLSSELSATAAAASVTLDLGTVTAGDRIFVSALIKKTLNGTLANSFSISGVATVSKNSGVATIEADHNESSLFGSEVFLYGTGAYVPATPATIFYKVSGFLKITGSGTLVLSAAVTSSTEALGAAITYVAASAEIYAVSIKKQ